MTQVTITMPDELSDFLQKEVLAGHGRSQSEVVAVALYRHKAHEQAREMRLAELRSEIAIGVAQADRGEMAPWDSEAIRAKGRALLAAAEAAAASSGPALG